MSGRPATVCRKGLHQLTDDNVYTPPGRPGSRECAECRRTRARSHPAIELELRVTIASLRAELAAARQQVRAQRHVIADLQRDIAALRRPRVVTHRRMADGGIGGRRERQQLRRAP